MENITVHHYRYASISIIIDNGSMCEYALAQCLPVPVSEVDIVLIVCYYEYNDGEIPARTGK